MSNLLRTLDRVNTSMFTFTDGCFSGEAAELKSFGPKRLYQDAADVGFYMVSARTGNEVLFVLTGETRQDGEVVSEEYVSVGNHPGIPCTIWNT